ncbi:hypothetical protein [Pedobacter steynii]
MLGLLKGGTIGNYFPSSVIEGMLAAIGLTLDTSNSFLMRWVWIQIFLVMKVSSKKIMKIHFSAIGGALSHFSLAAIVISVLSILVLIFLAKI